MARSSALAHPSSIPRLTAIDPGYRFDPAAISVCRIVNLLRIGSSAAYSTISDMRDVGWKDIGNPSVPPPQGWLCGSRFLPRRYLTECLLIGQREKRLEDPVLQEATRAVGPPGGKVGNFRAVANDFFNPKPARRH